MLRKILRNSVIATMVISLGMPSFVTQAAIVLPTTQFLYVCQKIRK